jgi:hypothetical protein
MTLPSRKNCLQILFFGVILAFGLRCVPDFGISVDEWVNNQNGAVSEKYVFKRLAAKQYHRLMASDSTFRATPELHSYCDKDYGVAFDLPVQLAEA